MCEKMYKMSTKHAVLYFLCIGKLYSVIYKWTTATFYIILPIVVNYKKYNIVCGTVSYTLSCSIPIKVYTIFILIMELYQFWSQNQLFIYFCKFATLYLNRSDSLRNRTNHGITVFWSYIGIYILLSICLCRCC